jgi:hypothetical protein
MAPPKYSNYSLERLTNGQIIYEEPLKMAIIDRPSFNLRRPWKQK